MFKFFPWDVRAATAIALVAVFLVAIFNSSPLLLIVIFFALCAYIAARQVASMIYFFVFPAALAGISLSG